MKKLLLLFIYALAFLPMMSFASRYDGTQTISNWRPGRGQNGAYIKTMTVKWKIEDYGGAEVKKFVAIQWYLGDFYVDKGQTYPMTSFGNDVLAKLSISNLVIRMNVYDVNNQQIGNVTFDAGITPPHGGAWGAEHSYTIPFDQLFTGISADSAQKIMRKGFSLKDASISQIQFGGTFYLDQKTPELKQDLDIQNTVNLGNSYLEAKDFDKASSTFKQGLIAHPNNKVLEERLNRVTYERAMFTGERSLNTNDLDNAYLQFAAALKAIPNDTPAKDKLEAIYFRWNQEGDAAFYRKDYVVAGIAYKKAAQIHPDDPALLKKIADLQTGSQKENYMALMQEGDKLKNNRDYNGATQRYQQAKAIFNDWELAQYFPGAPTPTARLTEVQGLVSQMNHDIAMQNGDRAFQSGDYNMAIKFYNDALSFMPMNLTAQNKITECKKQIDLAMRFDNEAKNLQNQYEAKIKEAKTKKVNAFSQASKSFEPSVENCNLDFYKFYKLQEEYFQKKLNVAREEAHYTIYGDFESKGKSNIGDMSISEPTCNQLDAKDALGNASPEQTFAASKRKWTLFNDTKEASMKQASQELLKMALQKNPKYAAAVAFQSNFTEDLVEKMKYIQNGLALEPSNNEIKQMNQLYQESFIKNIFEMVAMGNDADISKAMQANLIPVDMQMNGKSIFQQAIDNEQPKVLMTLLSGNANARLSQDKVQQMLFYAAEKNKPLCVQTLLRNGANCNSQNTKGETAMAVATRSNANEVVTVLATGCNSSSADVTQSLITAVDNNNVGIARTLLQAGGNVEQATRDGSTLIMNALAKNYDEMVKLLLEYKANVNVVSVNQSTPLSVAASAKSPKNILLLLKNGADLSGALAKALEKDMNTAQYLAEQSTQAALDMGNIDWVMAAQEVYPQLALARSASGEPFVFAAMTKKQEAVATVLLNSDVDFDAAYNGRKVLLEAANNGFSDFIRAFIEHSKGSLEVKNERNETALHLAARNGYTEIVKRLLAGRISPDERDNKGNTAFMVAIEAQKTETAMEFFNYNFSYTTVNLRNLMPIHLAVLLKNRQIVETLLEKGVDVNVKGEDGMTPLHLAAKVGDSPMCTFLLNKGANKAALDNFKRTPAKVAKASKQKAIAKMLK